MMSAPKCVACLLLLLALPALAPTIALANPPATRPFLTTWERTDRPVAAHEVNRTWMWGPEAFTGPLAEPYSESPSGERQVQYYDKSRMEISDPEGDTESIWYVTNGLLVMELVTGRLQLGDNTYEQHEPANVNIAGDFDDPNGPTYATVAELLAESPLEVGANVIQRVDRDGTATDDSALADRGVTAAYHVPETNHTVASPFWEFMNSTGLVFVDGGFAEAPLFQSPFFATGFPIAEPFWAAVKVAGVEQDVMIQCFERRCLTYTPDNDPGWQVESGNVGRHYYEWRYGELGEIPKPMPVPTTGEVQIISILADPPELGESEGEYVDIRNQAATPIDMSGWRLEDSAGSAYTFPEGFVLGLDAAVRIHICDGTNSGTDLYWGRCSPVWNNSGDTATLYDAAGTLIHQYSY